MGIKTEAARGNNAEWQPQPQIQMFQQQRQRIDGLQQQQQLLSQQAVRSNIATTTTRY